MSRRTAILTGAVVIVAGGVVVALLVRHHSSNHNGPGAFLGRASNAVVFIQWTRTGNSLSGSLDEAITKLPAGSGVSSNDESFSGVIEGTGLSLQAQNGKGLVGQFNQENKFTLSLPGNEGGLISVNFSPANVRQYNHAVENLDLSEYSSPCDLYVQGHNAMLEISGTEAQVHCADFMHRISREGWTTELQEAGESGGVVCELTNGESERAVVTDTGGREYGGEACRALSEEGWE